MSLDKIISAFYQQNKDIFVFVLDTNLAILESNKDYKGNFLDFLNGEDKLKFSQRAVKQDGGEILFFLNSIEGDIVSIKASCWNYEENIILIGKKYPINNYFELLNKTETSRTFFVKIDENGLVTESNAINFKEKTNFTSNLNNEDKQKFESAFNYCLKNNCITGFEVNKSKNFDSSTVYRFIPQKEGNKMLITLSIRNLDFTSVDFESNNYFQNLIDSSADFIYKNDAWGNFIFINESAKKRYGFDDLKTKSGNFKDWVRDDYRESVEQFYYNQFKSKTESTYIEFPTITDDGDEIWIGQNVSLILSGGWVLSIQTTCRDISESKTIEAELMEIQNKNQAILDSIPDSMYLFDYRHLLLDKKVNDGSYFFDLQVGDKLQNSSITNLVLNRMLEEIDKCFKSKEISRFEINSNITGQDQNYDIRIAPVNEQQVLILVRNNTEIILQQKKLLKVQEKQKHLLDTKQRYLSFMTHEIRTPLNAIIGLTDLIFDTSPTPTQMEYLKSIKSSSSILSKIINDVLDFNKLENDKIKVDPINFNLVSIFKDVIRTCTIYSYNKPVKLEQEIDKLIPEIVKGDAFKLTQVLTNLISNALKFTQKGYVKASAKLLEATETSVSVQFTVKDTGIGIPSDKLEQVFNSYEQLDSSISRKFGGTGLGLTISQKFVQLMGGKIEIESTIDEGSSFGFKLTFEQTKEEIKKEKQVVKVDFSPYHILLVEDNEMNQLVMSKYFNKWGLSFDIAENGKEALEKLEENEYHLVLLDLEMPIMDGFEAAQHIRNHENDTINSIPIIALSASVFSEIEEKTRNIGFNDFIGKPINANYVYNKLADYLIKSANNSEQSDSFFNELDSLNFDGKEFDLTYLIESSLNDTKYIRKMVELFITKTPDYLKEIEQLNKEYNYTELRKIAHKFKASVAIMGIQRAEIAIHHLESDINNNTYHQLTSYISKIKESALKACDELKEMLEVNSIF
jgi:PAS domain S-box-containing protein